jgi:serine/threonine-protein kinase
MTGSKPSFWSRLGFGTVPGGGDAEETRAFLQKRLAFFVGVVSLLWLAISVTSTGSAALYMPEMLKGPGVLRAGIVHNAATLALIVCWLVCRRGKRSFATLGWIDAGIAIGQAGVMSTIMNAVDMRYRPDMSMTMGVACLLIGRAAVVPSNGTRTLALGVLSALPVLGSTLYTHAGLTGAARLMPPAVAGWQIGCWLGFAVLLSTTISRVIYGLSIKVQEAARLGQYTLERKIGEGAMGVVYLARHALLRRPTAIKLLSPGREGQQDLDRFEREVQTTSALRHPNTVAIYDYGRTPEGVFYYAMEYLDGVDLERLITTEGPLPDGRVVHILAQIAGALEEAHDAGLIHRDIKPSNILLCNHGHQPDFAKVLDFGLVKEATTAATASGSGVQTLTGTPLYMSPEAITTPSRIDARSDLYALGALGYALLTGEPPFVGMTAVEVCSHHLHTPVVPPSRRRSVAMSPDLEALVLACLAKDREQRPPSAAELAASLAACEGIVEPWSPADARAWWAARGTVLRAQRSSRTARSGVGETVVIDLAARAQAEN